jgi:hypothetical protein
MVSLAHPRPTWCILESFRISPLVWNDSCPSSVFRTVLIAVHRAQLVLAHLFRVTVMTHTVALSGSPPVMRGFYKEIISRYPWISVHVSMLCIAARLVFKHVAFRVPGPVWSPPSMTNRLPGCLVWNVPIRRPCSRRTFVSWACDCRSRARFGLVFGMHGLVHIYLIY